MLEDGQSAVTVGKPDEHGLDPYFSDIYNYMRAIEVGIIGHVFYSHLSASPAAQAVI